MAAIMKPKIFISFLMPYPIRGIEAPYLWIFYKQLSSFRSDQIIFIGSPAYTKAASDFESPRNEVTLDGAHFFGYDIPSPEETARYRFIEFDNAVFDPLEQKHAYNSDQVFADILRYTDDSVVRYLQTLISDLQDDYDVLGILSWCNVPSLSAAADGWGIPVIHNELGALRSPLYASTAYFDFSGVNGHTESEARFEHFKQQVSPHTLLTLPEIRNLITCTHAQPLVAQEEPAFDFGIVLQVEDDSNILAFSNGFDSISLIKWVKSTFRGKTLCLREHPGGHLHYDKLGEIDHSANSLSFLFRCDTIVTINSSVALEALLFGKKALILGDNPFKFLTQFDDPDELLYGLNFAVFSYLIPYDFLFDYDYYLWRLNNRNEAAIFDKHVAYYREKKIDLCRQTPIAAENTETISTPFIQLFFDVGEGICEEASIKMSVSAGDYIQECVFDLSDKNFTNLRLDPLNDSCVIEIESLLLVEENEMQIDLTTEISTNCCSRSEKRFFFETDDSQIFLRVPNESEPSKAKKLIVSIRYVYIGREAVHACVGQILHNKAEEIAALSRTFEKELSDKEHTIAIKEEALQNTYAELVSTQNKLSQILSSNSWRITAPLRSAVQLITDIKTKNQ
ncbi:hypothetical protein [Sulfuricurvum sp.]|uniref:GT99 family glycosyltransferase N-terminal domain-containing protein n=1 Tax=Sulfuricurvum sp. TaxID=2025608 RepID=UPI0026190F02|nr:hypothetical protein [Sulfuricurvum sp.]